ncbi:MAG TPA: hypothetical protein VF610_09095, partial [Segetibacter sp.]
MKQKALLGFVIFISFAASAQKTARTVEERCGTMTRLAAKFERNPALKARFENQRTQFNEALREGQFKSFERTAREAGSGERTFTSIPVVFHIVSRTPANITDLQIQAQLDSLNKDFAGINADSSKIPAYFKPLFGKSGIQFCLARRTPRNENTSGIERITTSQNSFSSNDNIKHASTGGADAWDTEKYFNVWLGTLSNNLLGYSTFPNEGPASEQGVVIDSRTLPRGSFTDYNTGKTLVHET